MIRSLASPAGWLSLLSGCVLPLAFAPFELWPLAFFAAGGLVIACRAATPITAFRRGWLFGLGMFGCGVSWVQVSIHQFGLAVLWFSVSITVVFILFLAVFSGLAASLAVSLSRSLPASLAWAASWTLIEGLRSWILTGFPWLLIGYSQIGTPLDAWAPPGGVLAVSFVVVLLAALAVDLCFAPRKHIPLLFAGALLVVSFALRTVQWTSASGDAVSVALVQGNVEQSVKWRPDQRERTLALYRALSDDHWNRDLIVWPETAIPAFSFQVTEFLDQLGARARATETRLLVGVPVYDPLQEIYFNSILVLGGDSDARYDKRHLVPFGEYLPLRSVLGPMLTFLSIPMSQFANGSLNQGLLPVGDWVFGASICYEDAFGELVASALPEADILVNVSNDAWFGDSLAPHQHLQIARMRARESGRYMLRATNNGISALIDARGDILERSPQFEAYVLTGEVRPHHGSTPFSRWHSWPVLGLSVVCLLVGMGRRPRQVGESEHE